MDKKYLLGTAPKEWSTTALDAMFIVTEDCNLRCKYCYITHKASNKRMNFETAKEFIDLLLSGELSTQKDIVLDFIGGEPFLEIELIDQICDYFKLTAYEKNSSWFWNYRINITTNGINYSNEKVQNFFKKNNGKCSICITIDGTKEKHDSQRVFVNGDGSYDAVDKNIPLYISQFGGRTKATFASDDLIYLKDSIIELWNKGITIITANVVFEDVWKEGDDDLLEEQLKAVADYAIDNHVFDKYICTFFDDELHGYLTEDDLIKATCGAGKMIALGPNGNIYPCLRYKDYSLNNQDEWVIGTVKDGIDMEKVRPFMVVSKKYQSDNECLSCELGRGCSYCQGHCYDESETATIFSRAKYICKMHKARVRANDYYFSKLFNVYGIDTNLKNVEQKQMYFLLSDDYVSYCQNKNVSTLQNCMDTNMIICGLKYARHNFYAPVFVHSKSSFQFDMVKEYDNYRIRHIVYADFYKEAAILRDCLLVFDKENIDTPVSDLKECQLNIEADDISMLAKLTSKLFAKASSVKINVMNVDSHFNLQEYKNQLTLIMEEIFELEKAEGIIRTIDLFETIYNEEIKEHVEYHNCKAGDKTFILAPNGKYYICSGYYSNSPERSCGDISTGIGKIKNQHLFTHSYQPICKECEAYQCKNCVYLNENSTKEVNVSPSFNCQKSYIERSVANVFLKRKYPHINLREISGKDPVEKLVRTSTGENRVGYYTLK